MNDNLGDRMKMYENMGAGARFMPLLPVVARIDGRAFHSFTCGMKRPFDPTMTDMMVETTRYLVEETNASIGYCQSDEISLAWYSSDPTSQIYFDGRIAKMTSQLAAHATLEFNQQVGLYMPEFLSRRPTFDARVWTLPTLTEAANYFLWREWDATKNSISMAAQSFYSHAELQGKNSSELQEMIFQRGQNWNDYPAYFKRGTYIQRRKVSRAFTIDELDKLPPLHDARLNPDLQVERTEYKIIDLPILSTIVNRESVLFYGLPPYTEDDFKLFNL